MVSMFCAEMLLKMIKSNLLPWPLLTKKYQRNGARYREEFMVVKSCFQMKEG